MTTFRIEGKAFLKNEDCLVAMSKLKDASVDMILCDLPYGTTQNKWDSVIPMEVLWRHYWRLLKPNGAVVLTAQTPFDKILGCSQIEYLKYEWVWEKEAGTGFLNAKKAPLKNHENVLVFYKKPPTYHPQMRQGFKPYSCKKGGETSNYNASGEVSTVSDGSRYPLSVLRFPRDKGGLHPTQKPVALMEYMIHTYTQEGEVVLDNCMGSGTTGVACVNLNRRFIGFELDSGYFDVAKERITKAAEAATAP